MTDHEFKAPERTITAPDETTARLGEIRERVAAGCGLWPRRCEPWLTLTCSLR